jgi:hypothetical protein
MSLANALNNEPREAAWDAPIMMAQPNRYGMGDIFGTQENFEKYRIARLVERRADELRENKRLILLGYGSFRCFASVESGRTLRLG